MAGSNAKVRANIKKALSEVTPKFARWTQVTVGGVFSQLKLRDRTRQSNNMSDNGAMTTALVELLGPVTLDAALLLLRPLVKLLSKEAGLAAGKAIGKRLIQTGSK